MRCLFAYNIFCCCCLLFLLLLLLHSKYAKRHLSWSVLVSLAVSWLCSVYGIRFGSVRGIIADYLSLRWQLNTSNKLPHLGLFFHSFIRFFGFSFRTFLIAFTFTLVSTNLPLPSPLSSASPSSTHLLALFVFAFVSIWIRDICSFVVGFVWLDGAISLALPSLWQLLSFALSLTLSLSLLLSLFVICTAITGAYTDFRSYSALRASFVFGAIFPAIFPNWRLKANQLNPQPPACPLPLVVSLLLRLYWHTPRLIWFEAGKVIWNHL